MTDKRIFIKYKQNYLFIYLDKKLFLVQPLLLCKNNNSLSSMAFTHLYVLKLLARVGFISNLKK